MQWDQQNFVLRWRAELRDELRIHLGHRAPQCRPRRHYVAGRGSGKVEREILDAIAVVESTGLPAGRCPGFHHEQHGPAAVAHGRVQQRTQHFLLSFPGMDRGNILQQIGGLRSAGSRTSRQFCLDFFQDALHQFRARLRHVALQHLGNCLFDES